MAKAKSYDNSTKLVKCNCRHAFQDNEYGEGQRLANRCKQSTGASQYRCTVCDKTH